MYATTGEAEPLQGSAAYMNLSNAEKGQLIFKDVKNSYTFWAIKKAIKDEVVKGRGKASDIQEQIPRLLKELNLETKIKNKVHELLDRNGYFNETSKVTATKFKNCSNTSSLPDPFFDQENEPMDALQTSRRQWNEHLRTKLGNFIRNSRKPIMRLKKEKKAPPKKAAPKKEEDEDDTQSKDDDGVSVTSSQAQSATTKETTTANQKEVSIHQIGNGSPMGNFVATDSIYDWKSFYDCITKIQSVNLSSNMNLTWGAIKLQFKTSTLERIRGRLIELNVQMRQIGMDEEKSFVDERILIGERLLQKDYQPFLVQYAKRGIPPSLRNRMYRKILYAEVTQKEIDYYAQTYELAAKWETALDDLVMSDIFEICNDDKYFIFQDMMEACVMFFYRDRQVFDLMKLKPHAPIVAQAANEKPVGVFPQAGLLPCQHFSRYCAPFCYISDSKEECYFIFRAMYCKYFCQLQSISNSPESIVSLCKLFEDLLQMYEPEVCFHMNQLGIQPLRTAFQWIYFCFVGTLEVDQIFLLMDRIIGFETLEILPILAAGIFVFRSNLILNCTNQEEFDELFLDLSQIKVMPIIQHFLFATGIN